MHPGQPMSAPSSSTPTMTASPRNGTTSGPGHLHQRRAAGREGRQGSRHRYSPRVELRAHPNRRWPARRARPLPRSRRQRSDGVETSGKTSGQFGRHGGDVAVKSQQCRPSTATHAVRGRTTTRSTTERQRSTKGSLSRVISPPRSTCPQARFSPFKTTVELPANGKLTIPG
jgi:hypothetical protein